jgi:hypothetical protein
MSTGTLPPYPKFALPYFQKDVDARVKPGHDG